MTIAAQYTLNLIKVSLFAVDQLDNLRIQLKILEFQQGIDPFGITL